MGYNNNSVQNENVFQPTATSLLAISSVAKYYILINPFHRLEEERTEPLNSKLLVTPTISGSPYYHTS